MHEQVARKETEAIGIGDRRFVPYTEFGYNYVMDALSSSLRFCFAWFAALVTAAFVTAGTTRAAGDPDFGNYHALIIGINDYAHFRNLETAVNDASAMHDVLRRDYGFQSTLLLNPTRNQLVRALDKLRAELTESDNLVIYYAGHGVLDAPTDEGFWLPANAEADSQVEWVSNSTVTRTLRASAAKHVLVIADSCYAGTLTRDISIVLTTDFDRQIELERVSRKRTRKALTSGGLEPVADGGGDGHSVFTRALLEMLRRNTQVLDGYRLYSELRRHVTVNADQTPVYATIRLAGDEGGDFLFVPVSARLSAASSTATARAETPLPNSDVELEFWRSAQETGHADDLRAYLEQYPDGRFAALAHNKLQRSDEVAVDASQFSGTWKTDVLDYSAGSADVFYTFDFTVIGERLVGNLGFSFTTGQAVHNGILDGQVTGDSFSFRTSHVTWDTKFEVDAGGAPRAKRTRILYSVFYYGSLRGGEIHIVRQDDRGKPPEEFWAQRVDDM